MKKHELIFGIIKLPVEFILVFAAFFAAREIRLVTDLIPWVQLPIQRISEWELVAFALFWALLYVLVFALYGLYRMRFTETGGDQFPRIISATGTWFLYYVALVYLGNWYLYHNVEIPRLIIFFTVILSVVWVLVMRFGLQAFQNILLKRGVLPKTRILVLSDSGVNSEIFAEVGENPGYQMVGFANSTPPRDVGGFENLVWSDVVIERIRLRELDEILSLDSGFTRDELAKISQFARIYWVNFRYADRFFLSQSHQTDVMFIAWAPVMEVRSIGLGPWGRVMKRTFDIVCAGTWILIISPLLVTLALVIWLSDGHSPVYRSIRVGRMWQLFPMYKFRSMRPEAEKEKATLLSKNERKDGPLFKIENDPRITRLWHFLRKYDLDELPQLFNVLLGNMSLIGPRPHLPDEVSRYEEHQKQVLTLKPGITGMAQVNGRHKNTFENEVNLDVFYIENWTLWLDIHILFKTVAVVIGRGGR